jgi:outer membrane receptor protein involved in Fe transport
LRVEAHELEGSTSENAFTPLITGQWDATDDTMLYLTYVEGFKSGGYDNRSNANPDPAFVTPGQNPATAATIVGAWEFDKEEASSIEFGAKNTLADGAAELNLAVFYTEYDDLQTSVFDGGIGFNVANAGKATTQGVEMDGRWALHEYFSLAGSLAYLDFEFDEFPVAQCYFGQIQLDPGTVTNAALSLCDAAGERKEYTPEWKGVISGDFSYPLMDGLELRAGADVQFSDSYIWTPQLDPRTEQDAYYKVNARIALKSDVDTWEVALIGNNLTDERVVDYGGTAVLAGTLTSGTGMAYYAFTNRPRTYAIQGTWRF